MKAHVAISATDLDASIHFYTQLGFTIERRYQHQTLDGEWALMRKNAFLIELFCLKKVTGVQSTRTMTAPGLHHIGIEVENIDSVLDRIKQKAKIQPGTAVHRYAFITDPDNTHIELFEAKQ